MFLFAIIIFFVFFFLVRKHALCMKFGLNLPCSQTLEQAVKRVATEVQGLCLTFVCLHLMPYLWTFVYLQAWPLCTCLTFMYLQTWPLCTCRLDLCAPADLTFVHLQTWPLCTCRLDLCVLAGDHDAVQHDQPGQVTWLAHVLDGGVRRRQRRHRAQGATPAFCSPSLWKRCKVVLELQWLQTWRDFWFRIDRTASLSLHEWMQCCNTWSGMQWCMALNELIFGSIISLPFLQAYLIYNLIMSSAFIVHTLLYYGAIMLGLFGAGLGVSGEKRTS